MSSISSKLGLLPQRITSNKEADYYRQTATDNIGYLLLENSFSTMSSAICTHSITPSTHIPLRNVVGICYLSASSTSEQDAQQEGRYLSQLLFDSNVYGIHNNSTIAPSSDSDARSRIVQSLLHFWDEYLSANAEHHLLQYFYGDGCYAISQALQITPYKQRITVVGINSSSQINHPSVFLFQAPTNNDTQTIRDPVFTPGLLRAFYEAAAKSPWGIANTSLEVIQNSYGLEQCLLPNRDTSKGTESKYSLDQNERSSEHNRHILNAALACLRLGAYSFLAFRDAVAITHTSHHATAHRQRRSSTAENTTATFPTLQQHPLL